MTSTGTTFVRSVSTRTERGAGEDGREEREVEGSRMTSSVRTSEGREVKYRKSSSSRCVSGVRSSSVHKERERSVRDVLRRVDQHCLYLCSETGNSFVVYGESSERYTVCVGPQTCSCGANSSQGSLGCVHLLFVMCKVLQVHETDPLLLADRLGHLQVEELFQRFNKRRKKLVQMKNTYKSNDNDLRFNNCDGRGEGNFQRDSKKIVKEETIEPHSFPSIDEITCSICLQEMNFSQPLIYCRFCNNEFHKKCITIWKKECTKQKEELTCPLCRKQWPPDDLNSEVTSPSSDVQTSRDYTCHPLGLPCQRSDLEITNASSSTSDLIRSSVYFNMTGSRSSGSIVSSSRKPLGYCFSSEVAEMLSSEMMDKREAGLRLVAEKTVHIVLSAGSANSTIDARLSNLTETIGHDLVSSMGGHTTGMMLKEAFHVIARLLDDINYKLFVGALRAFREILGFLVCRSENDVERMSRMISPVFCQLLRICGDSSHKRKSQMSLSALFELAKGQEGGMALGRELKTTSLQVTGWQRMSKFVLSNNSRFRAAHCYGRLALTERLVEKFDLTPDILRKILEFVANQLILMHRCLQLANSNSGKLEMTETTDVDTGLTSSDILLFSGQRLHKLAKVVFISTAKLIMSKLKFNGWSSQDIYTELWKELNKLPQPWKEKFVIKLKLPWRDYTVCSIQETEKVVQIEKNPKERPSNIPTSTSANNVSKSYRLSKRCSNIRPVGTANRINGLQSASSVTSLKIRAGNISQSMRSSSSSSCRISPFIRITPEPAYDAVPASESEDEMTHEPSSVFFSELAIHNSIYGHQFGLQKSSVDEQNEEEAIKMSSTILKLVVNSVKEDQDEQDVESQAPPGLGVFTTEYRSGYEWCQGPLLGTGAFSKCYQGRDVRTGLLMAVKQIAISHSCVDKNEEVINAVKTEVNLMIQLRHPNVLPLLGAVFSSSDNTISMFIRWMPGGSVASLLSQYGAFLEPATLAYSIQTARGLSYIHSNRILHRDLKGANLLLDSSGMRLRISDFGASARLSNGRDSNAGEFKGQLLGTIAFMAPEVLRGEEYGRSCDVWSFACCIIEMLTGSQPWRDRNHTNHLALMYTIASAEDPPSLPEKISSDLNDLLKDCLNREPKMRPLSSQLEHFKVFREFTQ